MRRQWTCPRAAVASVLVGCLTLGVSAKPIAYELPEETADFKPGPGVEIARAHCTACHSADYVTTQPRESAFDRAFWQGVVAKMIKVHGAPIDEREAEKIVDYLSKAYR